MKHETKSFLMNATGNVIFIVMFKAHSSELNIFKYIVK